MYAINVRVEHWVSQAVRTSLENVKYLIQYCCRYILLLLVANTLHDVVNDRATCKRTACGMSSAQWSVVYTSEQSLNVRRSLLTFTARCPWHHLTSWWRNLIVQVSGRCHTWTTSHPLTLRTNPSVIHLISLPLPISYMRWSYTHIITLLMVIYIRRRRVKVIIRE